MKALGLLNKTLFEDGEIQPEPINVAKVKQLSPFRYPGGKTWLVPYVRSWVKQLGFRPSIIVEPFAGGAIISLTAIYENWVDGAVLSEIDPYVAAVWKTILYGDVNYLVERIKTFDLTEETLQAELARAPETMEDRAFQTILRNRTNHGGILAAGASRVKYGENGKGLASRWYPETLTRRILTIRHFSQRIKFYHEDGFKIIQDMVAQPGVCFVIDPPYTAGGKRAGQRLYNHWQVDHNRLFHLMDNLASQFLATYDESEEIISLATSKRFQMALVPMQNTHLVKKWELLIGRDLSWLARTSLSFKTVMA